MKSKSNKNLPKRLVMYFSGLFIMTLGIAVSVKSDLGVSPVSSIPYTLTCVWGIEMGKATILFHCALVLLQIILLRRNFKIKNLLQLPVGVVFGYFTTFCNRCMSFLPAPQSLAVRGVMMLLSTVLIALGIFFYLPADIVPVAGEAAAQAVAQVTKVAFPKIKVCFDVGMVTVSLVVCLVFIKKLGSVGAGTVAAAVLTGTVLGFITKHLAPRRDRLFGISKSKICTPDEVSEKSS